VIRGSGNHASWILRNSVGDWISMRFDEIWNCGQRPIFLIGDIRPAEPARLQSRPACRGFHPLQTHSAQVSSTAGGAARPDGCLARRIACRRDKTDINDSFAGFVIHAGANVLGTAQQMALGGRPAARHQMALEELFPVKAMSWPPYLDDRDAEAELTENE
jgi:hypothetical protein